ncbi:MAG: GntR family transcriptional regulator [Archangiaceae bacterium]|nr:GntR family transcriptional regulator [Archangiaceae bacterium]
MRSPFKTPHARHRPAVHAERVLVGLILSRRCPAGSTLPPERHLAQQLGVTRPTLREALQRLDRDGWIEIRHGKATRVRDVWREGGLNVLAAAVRSGGRLPPRFVSHLLEVRLALAPAYARAAAAAAPGAVLAALEQRRPTAAEPYAEFDWALHAALAAASGNPVFTLILNGFGDLYRQLARRYFTAPAARLASSRFYAALERAVRAGQPGRAERVTRAAMQHSLARWKALES